MTDLFSGVNLHCGCCPRPSASDKTQIEFQGLCRACFVGEKAGSSPKNVLEDRLLWAIAYQGFEVAKEGNVANASAGPGRLSLKLTQDEALLKAIAYQGYDGFGEEDAHLSRREHTAGPSMRSCSGGGGGDSMWEGLLLFLFPVFADARCCFQDAGASARDDFASAPPRGALAGEEDGRSFVGSAGSGPARTGSVRGSVTRLGAPLLLMHRPVPRAPASLGASAATLGNGSVGRARPQGPARASVPGSRAERLLEERRAEVSRTDAAARLAEGRAHARAALDRANAPYRVHCLYLVRSGPSAAQPLHIIPGGPTYAARARMRVDAEGLLLSPRITSPRARFERGPGVAAQRRSRAAAAPGGGGGSTAAW